MTTAIIVQVNYEIGLAAFGPTQDNGIFYLETVFGGLCGRGWKVKVDENEILESEIIWMS